MFKVFKLQKYFQLPVVAVELSKVVGVARAAAVADIVVVAAVAVANVCVVLDQSERCHVQDQIGSFRRPDPSLPDLHPDRQVPSMDPTFLDPVIRILNDLPLIREIRAEKPDCRNCRAGSHRLLLSLNPLTEIVRKQS